VPSTPAALNGALVSPAATVLDAVHPGEGVAATEAGSNAVVVVLDGAADDVEVVSVAALLPLLEHAVSVSTSATRAAGARDMAGP
jgi:hypothetical protein